MGRGVLLALCWGASSWAPCSALLDSAGLGWLSWGLSGGSSPGGAVPEEEPGASPAAVSWELPPVGAPHSSLEEWLAAIQFMVPDSAIPPITTHFKILFGDVSVQVRIYHLVCQGLRVGLLTPGGASAHGSDGGLSSSTRDGELAVRAEKVSATCKASVDYSSSLGLSGSAEAHVDAQDAAAGLRVRLASSDQKAPRVPDAVEFSDCSSSLNLQLTIDSGTVWSELTRHIPSLVHKLQDLVTQELDKFVCGPALDGAKGALGGLMRQAHDVAHGYISAAGPPAPRWNERFVPLQDVPLARWLVQLDDQLQERPGIYNDMVQRVLPGGHWPAIGNSAWAVSGKTCILGGDKDTDCVFARSLHREPSADLRIEVEAADLTANFSDIRPLEPVNASVKAEGFASEAAALVTINISFSGWAGGSEARGLTSLVGLDLGLKAVNASGKMFLGLDRSSFDQVPSYRFLPLQCVAPSFDTVGFTDLACSFRLDRAVLTVLNSTNSTPSPLFAQSVVVANRALAMLGEYSEVIDDVLSGYLRSNVTELATSHLNRWASDMRSADCPEPMGEETGEGHPPLINPPLAMIFMWTALVFAVVTGLCAAVHVVQSCARRLPSSSARASGDPGPRTRLAAQVPRALSVTMVLAILTCILFLMGSNFLQMAQTFVTLEVGMGRYGEPTSSVRFYQVMVYSIFFSIKKLIEEGGIAEFLAYVLMCFSGILPYAKLITMLACWVVPSSKDFSRKWRGRALLFMDLIGKFSLADVFVIQFISASMHTVFRLSKPSPSGAPPDAPLSVVLRTSQEAGFTAFVLATVGSLIIGHVCLHCHETDPKVTHRHTRDALPAAAEDLARGPRCSLRDVYRLVPGCRRWHVAPVLFLCLALTVLGCMLPAFYVQLSSPLGPFSEATYSFYGFTEKLPELSEEPNSFSTRFSQGTYVFFGIISIHAHLGLMLVTWFGKLPPRALATANLLSHILFAYSATDVALLSMVLTLLEMSTSDFVPLNPGQQEMLGRLAGKEINCPHGLMVDVAMLPGTWLLTAAVLLHWWMGREVMICLERVVLAQGQSSASAPMLDQLQQWPSFTSENSGLRADMATYEPGRHATKADVHQQRSPSNSPQEPTSKRTIEMSRDAAPGEL